MELTGTSSSPVKIRVIKSRIVEVQPNLTFFALPGVAVIAGRTTIATASFAKGGV